VDSLPTYHVVHDDMHDDVRKRYLTLNQQEEDLAETSSSEETSSSTSEQDYDKDKDVMTSDDSYLQSSSGEESSEREGAALAN